MSWCRTISIDNFSFTPAMLTVKTGTTVTWTNRDDISHGIASSNKVFTRSKALDTDDSYLFTFTTPGTYQYFCYLHPHMVGSIVVESTTGNNATDAAISDSKYGSMRHRGDPVVEQERMPDTFR